MNRARLLKLAEFLGTVPAFKFDIASWRGHPDDDEDDDGDLTDDQMLDETCGTTGCAVGWACAMPEFQAEGLYWDNDYGAPGLVGWVRYEDFRNAIEVPAKFFDLTRGQADYLFMPKYYTLPCGPMEVARRIQSVTEMTPEQLELI